MYQVNLLPWRRQRRRRRARLVALALAAELLLASGLMGLQARRWQDQRLEFGARLTQWQQREKQALEPRLRRGQLLECQQRLESTLRLQRQAKAGNMRYRRLFEQLPGLLPPGLWLTRLRAHEEGLSLSGCSERYKDLSILHRRLSRHPLFAPVRWREIEQRENGRFNFDLHMPWPIGAMDDAAR